jgi:hypothetical protein
MTHPQNLLGPLVCSPASFIIDPLLTDAVDVAYDKTALHATTTDPNRYTIHVPTDTTRLSLGQKSTRWNTDIGITGYTDDHVHFETKEHDKTIVSLGGPAKTTAIPGHDKKVSSDSHGYSMVTAQNAWHDAKLQHHLLSQTEDMSLRTIGGGVRAVVQADAGKVDINGGVQVNVSGGGVSIAAGKLAVEKKGYLEPWIGTRHKSSAAGGTRILAAVAAALSAMADLRINKPRTKYAPGDLEGSPEDFFDKQKRNINKGLLAASLFKVGKLIATPSSPAKCVKLNAEESLTAMAGHDISVFGLMGANLGSALWASVTSGMSASLKGTVFAGVGAAFASMKGYRKVEMGSDWGDVFVGAQQEIHVEGHKSVAAGGDVVAHVASPSDEGCTLLGGGTRVWLGTPADGGWGLLLDAEGLALGKATGAEAMDTGKIAEVPALRINDKRISLRTATTMLKLEGNFCTISASKAHIRFEATSGTVTLSGSKILLK